MPTFDCASCGAAVPDGSDIPCAVSSYEAAAAVLICQAGTCAKPAQPEHTPCCSSTFHGKSFCCEHYCRSHFVEVGQCSPESHAAAQAVS